MKLTKDSIKDIRTADSMVIRFNGGYVVMELNFDKYDRELGITIHSRQVTYPLPKQKPELEGVWYMALYQNQRTHKGSIFKNCLRANDDISIYVRDSGNGYTRKAMINSHQLVLTVSRPKKSVKGDYSEVFEYVLDNQNCESNFALNIQHGLTRVEDMDTDTGRKLHEKPQ